MQITAAVARAKQTPLTIEEISLGEPRADEVLVLLVAAGICHTDISMRDHLIYPTATQRRLCINVRAHPVKARCHVRPLGD
jgi:Zn-dependent alcohol dehydrogenase